MIWQTWIGAGAAALAGGLLSAAFYQRRLGRATRKLDEQRQRHAQFLGMVSHELRTPLSSVLAFAEFLEDGLGGPLTAEQRVFVSRIQGATLQLQRLVDDLLDYNRITQGRFMLAIRPMEYRELVASIVDQVRPAFDLKGQTLTVVLPDHAVTLQADPERLGQVLLNLLSNASRYTPDGGRVEVEVRREGENLHTWVRDNGPGIPSAALERIFQPFYQISSEATPRQAGLGLGLAIALGLTRAHGGHLSVESTVGAGTAFRLQLPIEIKGCTHALTQPAVTQPLAQPSHA
ncbi:MAG TPA: HAMP domain-containing sensor histidine kinase [Stenomitos sp.]